MAGEQAALDLGARLRTLIASEVQAEVAKQLAQARLPKAPERLLTVGQVADQIGMSASFVRAAIRDGRLPSERIGRAVRIRAAILPALVRSRRGKSSLESTVDAERVLGLGQVRSAAAG